MTAKTTTAQLNELIVALTERVNALSEQNVLLAGELTRAHGRIDHAGEVFRALRKAVTPQRTNSRPVNAWRAALDELREERGLAAGAFVDKAAIQERMATRAAMAANGAAASH